MSETWESFFRSIYKEIVELFPDCKSVNRVDEDTFIEFCCNSVKEISEKGDDTDTINFAKYENSVSDILISIEILINDCGNKHMYIVREDKPSEQFNDRLKESGFEDTNDFEPGIRYYKRKIF